MQIQKISELSEHEFSATAHTALYLAMLARKYTISGPTNNVDSFLRDFKLTLTGIFHIMHISNYNGQRTVILYLSTDKDVKRLEKEEVRIQDRSITAV